MQRRGLAQTKIEWQGKRGRTLPRSAKIGALRAADQNIDRTTSG